MQEVAERTYDDIVEEKKANTGEVTGTEFGQQVRKGVDETKGRLREVLGDAAEEFNASIDRIAGKHSTQLKELVGDEHLGDTEKIGASGYVERDSKKMVLSKENANREVDDIAYRKRVRKHEDVHQNDQATSYTSNTIRALDDNTGEIVEVSVVGDLTEGQAIRKSGQPDGDLVPEYIKHRKQEEALAEIVGTSRIDSALQSGDTEALQREIDEKQRQKIFEELMTGGGLHNEQN